MGGSGGYFGHAKLDKLKEKVLNQESIANNQKLELDINKFLGELLATVNNRDVQSVNTHLQEIKKALDKEIEGSIDILLAGSVAKHTYVDGLSDIDSLVIINKSELKDMSPYGVKEYFYNRLKERFPTTEIKNGKLAVTLRFNDCEIQLLPAIKSGDQVKISDHNGESWSLINPSKFTSLLTKINKEQANKVVPIIKLAKAIISTFPERRQITGYHIESLAIEVFKKYDGPSKNIDMLRDFFKAASERVLSTIKDRTGQSIHVDDYLGSDNSLERKIVSDALDRVARKIESASSIEQWKDIFGG